MDKAAVSQNRYSRLFICLIMFLPLKYFVDFSLAGLFPVA